MATQDAEAYQRWLNDQAQYQAEVDRHLANQEARAEELAERREERWERNFWGD